MRFIYVESERDIPKAIVAHGLDRRFKYSIFVDTLVTNVFITETCTGCNEHGEYENGPAIGAGCHECGYTGKRRNCYPNAVEAKLGVNEFTKKIPLTMTPQTNTDKVKEEDDFIKIYDEVKIITEVAIKSAIDNNIANNGIFILGFYEGQKWQASKSYTPSEVNLLLERFRERCIAASSDFLSEGNIREIDCSDLLNK